MEVTRNSYEVEKDNIIYRRANIYDDFSEIAELIYRSDPYIYPYWFDDDIRSGIRSLSEMVATEGTVFNYQNCYVAYDKEGGHIVGVICAIDKSVDLNYNYDVLQGIDEKYKYTIGSYIFEIIDQVEKDNFMSLIVVCVSEAFRNRKIGTNLLENFISQMEEVGYEEFQTDCLLHNLRGKNLGHSLGFKEVNIFKGFDGKNPPEVEVVTFLRKKGEFLPQDFKKAS